jgi:hypothetical protein
VYKYLAFPWTFVFWVGNERGGPLSTFFFIPILGLQTNKAPLLRNKTTYLLILINHSNKKETNLFFSRVWYFRRNQIVPLQKKIIRDEIDMINRTHP